MDGNRWVILGRVIKPQGLRGEVKVACPRDWLDQAAGAGEVTLAKGEARRAMRIEAARTDGRFVYLKFAGIDGPDAAGTLRDAELLIEEERLARPPGGGPHGYELIGFSVEGTDGGRIGTVRDVIDLPTCRCLVVLTDRGPEVQVPVLGHVVRSIEKEAGRIVVDGERIAELM